MKFNFPGVFLSVTFASLGLVNSSLALENIDVIDVYTDDLYIITDVNVNPDTFAITVKEEYGETHLIPFPSQNGNAVVTKRNGDVQWFDKILTFNGLQLLQDFSASELEQFSLNFEVKNTSPFHWSDYHFEFYNADFTQRQVLPSVRVDWDLDRFDTGESVLGGSVIDISTTGTLPISPNQLIDGFNFYSTPGVRPGEVFNVSFFAQDVTSSFTIFELQEIFNDICSFDGECEIGIRQIATVSTPESSPLFGVMFLGLVGAGAMIKSHKKDMSVTTEN